MSRILLIALEVALLTACATSPDSSSATDIRGEEVNYEVNGVQMKGYMAWDHNRTTPRPGVLVVHEWWGQTDYIRSRARMLAKLGYTAFALDMYGGGKHTTHPADAQKFMSEVTANMDVAVARFEAAQRVLESHETTDPDKTAAIGYCFGGGVVLQMARAGADLDGVASFHGILSTQTPAEPGVVKARVLVCNGADDPLVPAEDVTAFKQEMADAGVKLTFRSYPGALHAFTNPSATAVAKTYDLPLAYDEAADVDSWSELEAFLYRCFHE